MAPVMETPATRREAIASLLAMLAFVLGAGESGAADFRAESAENSELAEQPDPASTKDWVGMMMLSSDDEALPFRTFYLDVRIGWNGEHVQLELSDFRSRDRSLADPEGSGMQFGRFDLVGDGLVGGGAGLLDELSSDADANWLRDETHWLKNPRVHCPACHCEAPKRYACPRCDRTGWVILSQEQAEQLIERRSRERQALIAATYTGHTS